MAIRLSRVSSRFASAIHSTYSFLQLGLRAAKTAEAFLSALSALVNSGGAAVRVLDDHWTAVTADGGLSAHFEHTIAVTEDGPEVLTTE